MPVDEDTQSLGGVGQKLDHAGEVVQKSVDTMGRAGAFGLTGALIARRNPTTAEKMRTIQTVYDNFGHKATTNMLGDWAVHSVVRRLPRKLKQPLQQGAKSFVRNKPLIARVIRFAGQVARAV